MSDLNKHTPGPWHRDKYGNVVDSNGERVVMRSVAVACSGSDEYIALAEANTDLATAAPDLFEVLQIVARRIQVCLGDGVDMGEGTMTRLLEDALPVIAKARGQS